MWEKAALGSLTAGPRGGPQCSEGQRGAATRHARLLGARHARDKIPADAQQHTTCFILSVCRREKGSQRQPRSPWARPGRCKPMQALSVLARLPLSLAPPRHTSRIATGISKIKQLLCVCGCSVCVIARLTFSQCRRLRVRHRGGVVLPRQRRRRARAPPEHVLQPGADPLRELPRPRRPCLRTVLW